jgi:hypothetical protein
MIASKLEKLDGILGTLDIFEMPSAERPGPSYFEDFQPDDESDGRVATPATRFR